MICIVLWTMAHRFFWAGAPHKWGAAITQTHQHTHARTHRKSHAKSSFCHKIDGFEWVRIALEAVRKSIDGIMLESSRCIFHTIRTLLLSIAGLQMKMQIYLWYSSENVACFDTHFQCGFIFLAHFFENTIRSGWIVIVITFASNPIGTREHERTMFILVTASTQENWEKLRIRTARAHHHFIHFIHIIQMIFQIWKLICASFWNKSLAFIVHTQRTHEHKWFSFELKIPSAFRVKKQNPYPHAARTILIVTKFRIAPPLLLW